MSNHALNIFSTASHKTDKAVIISSPCSSQNTLILSSRGFIMSEIFQTISAVFSLIHQKSVARAIASAVIHAIINQIGDIKKDNPEEMLKCKTSFTPAFAIFSKCSITSFTTSHDPAVSVDFSVERKKDASAPYFCVPPHFLPACLLYQLNPA